MPKKIRFAAGTENGLRSTVWRLSLGTDDSIALSSRMMGSDTKVSLHKSGLCQWSNTDTWVKKNISMGIRNADRHRYRWNRNIPFASEATLTFRLIIPESELRVISSERNLEKVQWLPSPQKGQSLVVEFYFTPPIQGIFDPNKFSYNLLVIWKLSDSSWFVAMLHIEEMTPENLKTLPEHALVSNLTPMKKYSSSAPIQGCRIF